MCMVYIHALHCDVQSKMGRNEGLDSRLPLAILLVAMCIHVHVCPVYWVGYNLHNGGVKAAFMIND